MSTLVREIAQREQIAWAGVPGGKEGSRRYVAKVIGDMRVLRLYMDLIALADLDSPVAVAFATEHAADVRILATGGKSPQQVFRNNARRMKLLAEVYKLDPLEQHHARLCKALHRRVQLGLAISRLVHMCV